MFQGFDFTQPGVMYFSQNRLQVMQEAYAGITQALARHFGDKVIVAGVQVVNGQVSAGWITYTDTLTGEIDILPLVAGAASPYVDIQDTITTIPYNDGTLKPVLKKRELVLVALQSATSVLFADLVRPGLYKDMWQPGDIKNHSCDLAYINANFDPVTWEALPTSRQHGWKIDLEAGGRVIVGWHPSNSQPAGDTAWSTDVHAIGNKFGEILHTLLAAESGLPDHDHMHGGSSNSGGLTGIKLDGVKDNQRLGTSLNGNPAGTVYNGAKDAQQGHNTMQPSIVYLTLKKL